MSGSVHNSPCHKRTTMGSRRGLLGDGKAHLPILQQESSPALYQPCHGNTPRKLSGGGVLITIVSTCSLNRSSMRERDASSMSAVNEVCDTSSWKVEICALEEILPDDEPLLHG